MINYENKKIWTNSRDSLYHSLGRLSTIVGNTLGIKTKLINNNKTMNGDNEESTTSPAQSPTNVEVEQPKKQETYTFYEALKMALDKGKKITKLEWNDEGYYGLIKDSLLKLHKPDGKNYDWILSDGDLAGVDWIILN